MIKRYDMYQDYDMLVKPEEFEGGDWVYYDDHPAELATLRDEITQLRNELEQERELADRLAIIVDENWQYAQYPKELINWRTRRNK